MLFFVVLDRLLLIERLYLIGVNYEIKFIGLVGWLDVE